MKVTLDLAKLLRDGAISLEEHDRLARLGRQDTSQLLVSVLVGFGVFAVSGGAVALMPNAMTGVALGSVLMVTGAGLMMSRRAEWSLLANICILVAALLLGSGIVLLSQGVSGLTSDARQAFTMPLPMAFLLVAALFAGAGGLARSSLLAVLTVLMLFAALGSTTGYAHATYDLQVTEPLATILLFSALALAAHIASRFVGGDWERLCTAIARTALFLVNLGFWIGSLWGDALDWLGRYAVPVPAIGFVVAWAVGLIAVGIWAGLGNRRWVLNLVTVFGAIHFYTQWFERLGATPVSILFGGMLVLVVAIALWQVNRRMPASRT